MASSNENLKKNVSSSPTNILENNQYLQSYLSDLKKWESEQRQKDRIFKENRITTLNNNSSVKSTPPSSSSPTTATTTTTTTNKSNILDNTNEAIKYKDKGNQFFAQQKYKDAIEYYTLAIQLDSSNSILFANRAMAYLKLKNYNQAEIECTRSINLDPTYIKAYHRRGLARVELKKFDDSIQDFKFVLKHEPNNKDTQKELDNAIKLKSLQPSTTITPPPQQQQTKPTITPTPPIVVPLNKNEENKTTTTPQEPKIIETPSTNSKLEKPDLNIQTLKPQTTTPTPTPTTATTTTKSPQLSLQERLARLSNIKAPLPKSAPKNSFEFEKVYNSLQGDESSIYSYFKLIDPSNLPIILNEVLTPSLFTSIISILDKFYLVNKEFELIYQILENLLKINKITLMIIPFMSTDEKKKQLKTCKTDMNKQQRQLDRELVQLKHVEQQTITQIKTLARQGRTDDARTMAKELVRVREQMKKIQSMKTTMNAVSTKTSTIQSTNTMVAAMATATKAMTTANSQYDIAKLQKTMTEYQKQVYHADVTDDMLQDMFENDEEDQEADDILSKVVDEVVLDNYSKMPGVSKDPFAVSTKSTAPSSGLSDAELDAEMKKLLSGI
eukprot:gene1239-1563_t